LMMTTLTSHILVSQGRGPEAAANMMRLLPKERPLPQDKVELLRMIAELTTQLDQFDEAEKLWREYAEYRPDQAMSLAKFLAQRGKVDEALQMAEQRRKAEPLVSILSVAAAAAKQQIHPLTAEQKQRVEGWFQRALRDDPDSIPVQIMWADFLDAQGRQDEMEKIYRSILARTDVAPNDRAGVANNLAFALAVQGRQLDEAMKLSQETIAQLGPVAEALDTRGLVFLAKGDTTQAIRDLKDAVSVLDPQSVMYVHLAMAQAAAKDMSAARHSLEKAKELKFNPDEMTSLDRKKYDALVEQLSKPS
jgi:tetratricopeptide (TPR) repeat protein